ncbi:MAG: RNA polymerase sigma factor [Candidatus Riflebacteria bacterium]|nr:RNA polymerase sigma factor [Candidatus Riflebacteria bacterium]
MSETTYQTLLLEIGKGNKKSFEIFYISISGRLFGFILRYVGSSVKAEEVFQDVMFRIWVKAPLFDPEKGKAITWIFRLAGNVAKNWLDSQKLAKNSEIPVDVGTSSEIFEKREAELELRNLNDGVISEKLERCLSMLPEDQRMSLLLRHVEGLSIEEISEILECPEGTVKSRIFNGLKKLRLEVESRKQNENSAGM